MDELTFKDLSKDELDLIKDIYISSRITSMSENDLREFAREIIEDQIKGTVGNAEEKEAWQEIKDHFAGELSQKILEVKSKSSKHNKQDERTPEELEFNRRLSLLKKQEEEKQNSDMWDDD